MDTFRIIMYIIITIVIVLLVYTKMHNDIKTQIIKINSAESKIDESLRQKYDLFRQIKTTKILKTLILLKTKNYHLLNLKEN